MFGWFKKLLYIVENYDSLSAEVRANQSCCTWLKSEIDDTAKEINHRVDWLKGEIDEGVQIIRDRTDMHLDVSPSMKGGPHQIILIGKYRNRDYIQTYSIPPDEFRELVQRFIEMKKYARASRIDAAPEMRTIINEESNKWWNDYA